MFVILFYALDYVTGVACQQEMLTPLEHLISLPFGGSHLSIHGPFTDFVIVHWIYGFLVNDSEFVLFWNIKIMTENLLGVPRYLTNQET